MTRPYTGAQRHQPEPTRPPMSNRPATRLGLPVAEERPADAFDIVVFEEPAIGALARTKGSLFLLAQLTGGSPQLQRAARDALEALRRDYYYDLSAGVLQALSRSLAAATFQRAFAACGVHEDPPHCLRRRREEVPATVPVLDFIDVHQPQIRLMHQRRRLERLPRLLLGQLLGRQLA